MSGGNLLATPVSPNFKMTEQEAKKHIRQICEALQHMHESNIVHLDIRPEHVVFETQVGNRLKIVDFGLAARLDPEDVVKVSTSAIDFVAPEIVQQDSVGFSTDMWAVGVLTYVL